MSFLSNGIKRTKKSLDDDNNAVVLALFKSIILDTPIDEGRARGNWHYSEGSPIFEISLNSFKSESESTDQLDAISQNKSKQYVLTNNLPYINALEYGSSKQAPAGMVRKNVARINNIIREQNK